MSHITLIRHGQANGDARDEAGYDKLSPLGKQQSAWLGEYLRASAAHHPRVFCGTLRRHEETAEAMGLPDATRTRVGKSSARAMARQASSRARSNGACSAS